MVDVIKPAAWFCLACVGALAACTIEPLDDLSPPATLELDASVAAQDPNPLPAEANPAAAASAAATEPSAAAGVEPAPVGSAAPDPNADAGVALAPVGAATTEPSPDAGVAAEPDPALAPPPALRSLSIHLTGMDDDLERFMQFRVVPEDNHFAVIGVVHEGMPQPDFTFELPHSLLAGQAYRLDFWIDHDLSGGYTPPPADHAWSVPLPAGDEDIVFEFAPTPDYTDIEKRPPTNATSLVLSSRDMSNYRHRLFDVRLIEEASGRLAGRQVREVPGDAFDLTVGSVVQPGLTYRVEVSVDADGDGRFDPALDPHWQLRGVAPELGFHLDFTPETAQSKPNAMPVKLPT